MSIHRCVFLEVKQNVFLWVIIVILEVRLPSHMTGKNLNKFNLSSTISGSVIAKLRFQTVICQVFFFFYLLLNPIRIQKRRAVNWKGLIYQINKRCATKTMLFGLFRIWLLIVYISSAGKWQLASLFLISNLLILKKRCWVLKGLAWGAFKLIFVDLRI